MPPFSGPAGSALVEYLRGWVTYLPVPAGAALSASGVFAWLQPGGPAERAAELPGMTGVIGWTTLVIAVPVAVALVSTLGVSGSRGTLFGGPWVILVLAFSLLNTAMLGAGIVVAHIVGPVTSNATVAVAPPHRMIYLPYLITAGVPLAALAALAAGGVFTMTELARRLRPRQLPEEMRKAYQEQYRALIDAQPERMKIWYWSGLPPFNAYGDVFRAGRLSLWWERKVARAQLRGSTVFNAGRLLWGIIIAQLVVILCAWLFHWQLSAFISILGVAVAGLALPTRLGFLYSRWRDPAQRSMTIFWDVAAFWPRSYHPFSPPCYSEQAVPDLQARMWLLGDIGRKLILVAHGQGTMWAVAALVQPGTRPGGQRQTLVTFGSTVGTLYAWGFPAYIDGALLGPLVPGGAARVDYWHNLYYPTDPIAGPAAGNLLGAYGSPVDLTLPDPDRCWYIYRDYPPMPRGHSGYWEDPRVWTLVNKLAAETQGIPANTISHQGPPPPAAAEARPSGLTSE